MGEGPTGWQHRISGSFIHRDGLEIYCVIPAKASNSVFLKKPLDPRLRGGDTCLLIFDYRLY